MDLGLGPGGLRDYPEGGLPRTISAVISADKARLIELDTVLGVRDLYELLDVLLTDAFNRQVLLETSRKG